MAITDIREYAHLSDADVEALGNELDSLRREIESDLGARDVAYLRRTIRAQRTLEIVGRVALLGSNKRSLWWLGAGSLSLAKIIENMELGHNVLHGQWDWMNDPEVHSDDVGMGHGVRGAALETLPQLHPSQVHKCAWHGPRRGVQHAARDA